MKASQSSFGPGTFILGILLGLVIGCMASFVAHYYYQKSERKLAALEGKRLEVSWNGMSIPESDFTVNGKPVGHGKEGYEQVLKAIIDLRSGAFILFRMPLEIRMAYDQKYQLDEELSFCLDQEVRKDFDRICALKNLRYSTAELKNKE